MSSVVYNKRVCICYSHTPLLVFLVSSMATQTDIPSELTNDDKALVFQILNAKLNSGILLALLYGEHRCSVSQYVDVD